MGYSRFYPYTPYRQHFPGRDGVGYRHLFQHHRSSLKLPDRLLLEKHATRCGEGPSAQAEAVGLQLQNW